MAFLENLNSLGIAIDIVGALMAAYSIYPTDDGYQEDDKGRKHHFILERSPRLTSISIVLIAFGMLLQFLSSVFNS